MLESLLRVVTEVKQRVKSAAQVSLFLDFDGTLVPIEADPSSPCLDLVTAEALQELPSRDSVVIHRYQWACGRGSVCSHSDTGPHLRWQPWAGNLRPKSTLCRATRDGPAAGTGTSVRRASRPTTADRRGDGRVQGTDCERPQPQGSGIRSSCD